ncbi:MAG: Do family serine endopeptidase [Nitrospinaceae bacterium]|nr:Do family serine endopeptidase [Nitrospinaceae bacterium]
MRKIRASREWKSMVNRLALALSAALLAAQATTVLAAPGAVFGDRTFIEAVKRIRPSVVHIRVTLRQSSSKGLMDIFDRGKSPSFDFGSPSASAQTSVGAGVIISKDGYILTNQHIVKNAEEIRVKLHSGEEFTAKLNGVDKKTDLALLKIPAKAKLTPAKLGNSDAVEVGEWVLAVGSPFGLSHSASVGIISAKGRDLRQGPYDSYIQTDAAINPGNSGGPLANSRGEVIGINTIIYTRGLASKNQGVGFAVPINQAKPVIDDLRHKGYPIRGRLGISINAVPSKMGKKLGLARLEGARLATVIRGGPADKAGLERGDVVIEFDGKRVITWQTLPRVVARARPGAEAEVKFYRGEALQSVRVRIGSRSERPEKTRAQISNILGLEIKEITPRLASRFALKLESGLIVVAVKSRGPAERGGIRAGDEVVEINHTTVKTVSEFRKILRSLEGEDSALLILRRRGSNLYAAIRFR